MYRFRTVFISDLHLGSPDCQVSYLLNFLETVEAKRIYLVGDVIDLIAMQRRVYLPESHLAVIRRLVALAAEGRQIIYVPGNHDEFMRSFCGQSIAGIQMRLADWHTTADGRHFRVCHGDEFDHVVRCSPLLWLVGNPMHGVLVRLNRWLNHWRRARGKGYWSLAAYIKQRVARARAYIARFEQAALTATERQKADGYICGHIHSAGFRLGREGLYCNDGDWTEHCTALVEDSSGRLSLLHWSEEPRVLAYEPVPAGASGSSPALGSAVATNRVA
ncbi:MAG: UDP-2,3-diacylglucosamine diphosphatase [Pseudomonadota bacterium]